MNMKTGLYGLSLFVVAGALTISCGGSDGGDDNDSKAGTSSTSGASSGGSGTAGSPTAGANNSGGTTNNNGGTTNNNGGTTNNGGTRNNNNGGDPGNNGDAGDNGFPGFGGDGNVPGCPATTPTDGTPCMRVQGGLNFCPYDDQVCRCQGQQNDRMWSCDPIDGAGGAGGGFEADCPDNAMNGDDCDGFGQCTGQAGCACFQGQVFCQ